MPDDLQLDGARLAGRLLRSLLLERDRYRNRWLPHQRRTRHDSICQAAVAQVIALYLWESGERPESQTSLPRTLKDRVHRALHGESMTAETLDWFIRAFDISPDDAERLRVARFAHGNRHNIPILNTLRARPRLPLRQRHRTVAAFERRIIGPDGLAISHRTTRAIIACEDGVSTFPYRLVPGATQVAVLHGGRVTTWHEFPESSPIMEITLDKLLNRGQICSLEYRVEFDADLAIAPEYRRVAHARAENVDIVVQFHPTRRPAQVWWTLWDDHHGGNVLHQETVRLDKACCAHQFVPFMENAAAGFRWSW